MKTKPELLAPAGSFGKLATAFAFGADAVYFGLPDYSLRARINEFNPSLIRKAVRYAQESGKKAYATANFVPREQRLKNLPAHARLLKKCGVDAVIVSDPGVMEVLREEWPEVVIHLSTQANCLNSRSAKFWFDQGVERVVLGREASLKDIIQIKKAVPGLELECFVHGAMCVSYSGRCFLSRLSAGRSANEGDCIQPCRWKYEVVEKKSGDRLEVEEDQDGSYIFNSKDLCLIEHLDKLMVAGVDSFKIEGRTKSAYYVAAVAGAYRKAIDVFSSGDRSARKTVAGLKEDLAAKLFNRGYTEGFLLDGGRLEQNIAESHSLSEWEFCGQVIGNENLRTRVSGKNKREPVKAGTIKVNVHNTIKIGDELEIVCPGYDIIKMELSGMIDLETGLGLEEAHGGCGKIVGIDIGRFIPEYSVLRRRIKSSPQK